MTPEAEPNEAPVYGDCGFGGIGSGGGGGGGLRKIGSGSALASLSLGLPRVIFPSLGTFNIKLKMDSFEVEKNKTDSKILSTFYMSNNPHYSEHVAKIQPTPRKVRKKVVVVPNLFVRVQYYRKISTCSSI